MTTEPDLLDVDVFLVVVIETLVLLVVAVIHPDPPENVFTVSFMGAPYSLILLK